MVEGKQVHVSDDVTLNVEAAVASLCIHRPPHNFFDARLIKDVANACDRAAEVGARVVVLASEGKNFCAGMQFGGDESEADGDLYEHALRLFAQPLPIIATIQGAAVGGGLGLALAADLRVASPQARFSANFAKLGFHHGFGLSVTLPAVVGEQQALDLLYTGRRIDGEQAFRIGLCDRLVPADRLAREAHAYAEEIAASAPLAVQSIRRTMRGGLAGRIRTALEREKSEQDILMKTADWVEGLAAVKERRTARFIGR